MTAVPVATFPCHVFRHVEIVSDKVVIFLMFLQIGGWLCSCCKSRLKTLHIDIRSLFVADIRQPPDHAKLTSVPDSMRVGGLQFLECALLSLKELIRAKVFCTTGHGARNRTQTAMGCGKAERRLSWRATADFDKAHFFSSKQQVNLKCQAWCC